MLKLMENSTKFKKREKNRKKCQIQTGSQLFAGHWPLGACPFTGSTDNTVRRVQLGYY